MEPCPFSCCLTWLQPPMLSCGHGVHSQPLWESFCFFVQRRTGLKATPQHPNPMCTWAIPGEGQLLVHLPHLPSQAEATGPTGCQSHSCHKGDRQQADQLCSKQTHAGFQQSPSFLRTHKSSVSVICSGILPRDNHEMTGSSFPEPGEVVGYWADE